MPERVTLARQADGPDQAAWLARLGNARVRDIYDLQVAELAEIRLPGGSRQARESFIADYGAREPGVWSYYPWLDVALRTVAPDALYELRTNRNQNLVTRSEQDRLRTAHVAIAGMSVGSNIVSALARHGIGRTFSLADHDDLATSNLNRTPGRLLDVGVPKGQLAARALWEVDPFAACVVYPHGLDDDTVGGFVADSDVVFDEVDDFRVKVQLRLMARSHGKPLIMATNLGDTVLIDVERWDRPQDGLEPFNGQLDGVSLEDLTRPGLTPQDVSRFAAQVIGVDNVPLRALASLPLINRELVGRPQVASTAAMAGGLAAMAARAVLLDAPLRSGRYRISLTEAYGLPDDRGTPAEREAIMARLRPAALVAGQRPELHDPQTLADGDALTRLAAYATLAPSPHNTQPWRFRVAGCTLAIGPDPSRALAVADPRRRALAISLGCSAASVLVAAAAAGLGMSVQITPDGQVRLELAGSAADRALARLFPALTARVTDKRGYPAEMVEPPQLDWPEGIGVHYVADPRAREEVAALHRQAVGDLARTGAFAGELAGWLRADPADPRRDGMTLPLPPDAADALIAALRTSGEPLRQMGERDAQALAAGPLIGLLTSAEDTEAAWVRAGLAWQHLALAAHLSGLAVAPLTAVVENPATRRAACAYAPAGRHLQMLFRMGKSPGTLPPTARRDPAMDGSHGSDHRI
ncbi:MAG TPA: ThiF family adenylyltransferase [Streptosporangiaceae bacterium]|nr:ThiF family adenylyltransferase [Streptosporangiaceae bacterium]